MSLWCNSIAGSFRSLAWGLRPHPVTMGSTNEWNEWPLVVLQPPGMLVWMQSGCAAVQAQRGGTGGFCWLCWNTASRPDARASTRRQVPKPAAISVIKSLGLGGISWNPPSTCLNYLPSVKGLVFSHFLTPLSCLLISYTGIYAFNKAPGRPTEGLGFRLLIIHITALLDSSCFCNSVLKRSL